MKFTCETVTNFSDPSTQKFLSIRKAICLSVTDICITLTFIVLHTIFSLFFMSGLLRKTYAWKKSWYYEGGRRAQLIAHLHRCATFSNHRLRGSTPRSEPYIKNFASRWQTICSELWRFPSVELYTRRVTVISWLILPCLELTGCKYHTKRELGFVPAEPSF